MNNTRRVAIGVAAALACALLVPGHSPAVPAGASGVVAFIRDGDIWTVDPATGAPSAVSSTPGQVDLFARWAPDGTKLAFMSRPSTGAFDIHVMNADGSGNTNVTASPAEDGGPAWSPDGSRIAFYSSRDGNHEIYVMNVDGSGVSRLTTSAGEDVHPAWSPDGSKIAFLSTRTGNQEIFVMNADGSGAVNITNNAAVDNYPSWSPDGTHLVFSTFRGGNWEIFIMRADGTVQTNLTVSPGTDIRGAWAPDGEKIVFESQRVSATSRIFAMNADGTGQAQLTSGPNDLYPDWQRRPRSCAAAGADVDEAGPVSGAVHETVEGVAGAASPTVHELNCDVIVPLGL